MEKIMEKIHYWDPKCGWYHTADTNNMDLFPSELGKLADVTASGKFSVVDTWHGTFVISVTDSDDTCDTWTLSVSKCESKFSMTTEVKKTLAIHILFRKNGVAIDTIKLPSRLNNRVAWALGAKKWHKANTLEELEDYFRIHDEENERLLAAGKIQPGPCYAALRYNYGHCHAVVITDGRGDIYDGKYYIDGFLRRDEAVAILEKAIQLNGWYFSYPARVQYVLDNI